MKRSQIAGVDPPPPTITRAPAPGTTGRAAEESPSAASLLPVRSAEGAVAHAGSARSAVVARMTSGRTRWDTAQAPGRRQGGRGREYGAWRARPHALRWSVVGSRWLQPT